MRNNASIIMEKPVLDRNALTRALKALSDPTRLRMLRLLAVNRSQMCVCEFVDTLQERQYNVSKHLKILEQAGLIEGEREGRFLYYGLVDGGDATARLLYRLVSRPLRKHRYAAQVRGLRSQARDRQSDRTSSSWVTSFECKTRSRASRAR